MDTTIPDSTPKKQCTCCKQWMPATTEYFYQSENHLYGVRSQCRECVSNNGKHRIRVRPQDAQGNIQCSKCKQWKPSTPVFFYPLNNVSSDFKAACRDCEREGARKREEQKPKKYRHLKPGATTKRCSKCHIEKPLSDFWREYTRNGYRSRCIACERNFAPPQVEQKPLLLLTKVCLICQEEKNIDEFYITKGKSRDRYIPYCKKCNSEKSKQYRQEHLDEQRHKDHLRYAANTSPKRRDRRLRRDPYLMKQAEATKRYQAQEMGISQIEVVDYYSVFLRDNNFCYICEGEISSDHLIAFDHVIPLSKGGPHIESNVKLTHQVCNNRKCARLLEEMTTFQRRGV